MNNKATAKVGGFYVQLYAPIYNLVWLRKVQDRENCLNEIREEFPLRDWEWYEGYMLELDMRWNGELIHPIAQKCKEIFEKYLVDVRAD